MLLDLRFIVDFFDRHYYYMTLFTFLFSITNPNMYILFFSSFCNKLLNGRVGSTYLQQ